MNRLLLILFCMCGFGLFFSVQLGKDDEAAALLISSVVVFSAICIIQAIKENGGVR